MSEGESEKSRGVKLKGVTTESDDVETGGPGFHSIDFVNRRVKPKVNDLFVSDV